MFTGIVEATGEVVSLGRGASGARLVLRAGEIAGSVRIGDSIAVNGCCLTVNDCFQGRLSFDLLQETLDRTNLRAAASGSLVNLERALRADGRLGGHFVQGHVDCT